MFSSWRLGLFGLALLGAPATVGQVSVIQTPVNPTGIVCTVGSSPALIRGTDGAVCFCDVAQTPDAYTCAVGGGGGGAGANPTAQVGLSPVNGVASTLIRSDGAPALSQAITPVWTGSHEFDAQTNFDALVDIDRSTVAPGIDLTGLPVTGGSGFAGSSPSILLPRQGGYYGRNSDGSDAHLIGPWRNDAIAPNGTKMMLIGDPTNIQLISVDFNESLCPSWTSCGFDLKGHDIIDFKFIGNKAGLYDSVLGNALPWYSGTTIFDGFYAGLSSGRTQNADCPTSPVEATRECVSPTRLRLGVGNEVAPLEFSRTKLIGWRSEGVEFGESLWQGGQMLSLTASATNKCTHSGMTDTTNATCSGAGLTCTQASTDQDHGWSTSNTSLKADYNAGVSGAVSFDSAKCDETATTGDRWVARMFVYSSEDTERDFRFEILGGTCTAEDSDGGFPGADAQYRPRLRGGEWNEIRFDTGILPSGCNGQAIFPRITRQADSASGMNAACTGSVTPWDCCTGSGTGTCGGQVILYVDDITFHKAAAGDEDVGPHVSTDGTSGGRTLAAGTYFVGTAATAPQMLAENGAYLGTVQIFGSMQAPMIAGRWYGPRSAGYVDLSTTETYGANLLTAYPFPVARTTTFDRIGISVSLGQASTNARLGVYDMDETTGLCEALVLDAGEVSLASAVEVTATISLTLTPGWYCLAFVWNGTTAAMESVTAGENLYQWGGPSVGDQQAWGVIQRSYTYGALPDPFGTNTVANVEVPWIALRKQ